MGTIYQIKNASKSINIFPIISPNRIIKRRKRTSSNLELQHVATYSTFEAQSLNYHYFINYSIKIFFSIISRNT